MNRLTNLKFLFTVVAVLEFSYFLAAMMPPSIVRPITGWELNADGHWITKLMGIALLTQAYFAWTFRKNPLVNVAKGLAFYQIASATIDWVMWLIMKDEGIFNNPLARATVISAIASHYLLGFLMLYSISKTKTI